MLRNIVSFIFIYIFIISCDISPIAYEQSVPCTDCILELSFPDLQMESDGYYHLDFIDGSNQTFTRIDAQVGHDYEYVGWTSDTEYCFDWNGTEQCYNVVNSSSYSGSDGIASTIIGVHEEHIGNIVKVYCGYYTDYGTQYLDSLEVIIDE